MSDKKVLHALMLGDVCGQPGCRALFMGLQSLAKDVHADIIVVNGENAADGFGLSVPQMNQFFGLGVDVITSGNHIWQQEDILPYLDSESRLLRPANYPQGVKGHGYGVFATKLGPVAVINLQGRQEMPVTDDPFRVGAELAMKMRKQTPMILVDFHAEITDEKEALAFYLDGKVSALVGTHTHVQTDDAKILPGGTAYLTDLGLCGPKDSVIGSDPKLAVQKQLSQMPLKNPVSENNPGIQGVCLTIDAETGKALSIDRIQKTYL